MGCVVGVRRLLLKGSSGIPRVSKGSSQKLLFEGEFTKFIFYDLIKTVTQKIQWTSHVETMAT